MEIRKRQLPAGWYPEQAGLLVETIQGFAQHSKRQYAAESAVAPHAGWEYSGRLAYQAILNLKPCDTVVIVGGHLPPEDRVYAAFEQGFATPLGTITAASDLLDGLGRELNIKEDTLADNTVEIQLPLVKFLHPEAKVLYLRVGPSAYALKLAAALLRVARAGNRRLAVLGSTDLTHYGPSYGFTPQGIGKQGLNWVREVNDKKIIGALLELEPCRAMELAVTENSACSSGGAACACEFARLNNCRQGVLLDYYTSYDILPATSFVGYAGICFPGDSDA